MKEGYIFIDNLVMPALFAISDVEQNQGLMFRKPPVPNMAFLYKFPQVNKFWMKSTPAPLDIIFCHNGKISQICYGEPYSTRIIGNEELSDLVIELPAGTVEKNKIRLGSLAGIVKK